MRIFCLILLISREAVFFDPSAVETEIETLHQLEEEPEIAGEGAF